MTSLLIPNFHREECFNLELCKVELNEFIEVTDNLTCYYYSPVKVALDNMGGAPWLITYLPDSEDGPGGWAKGDIPEKYFNCKCWLSERKKAPQDTTKDGNEVSESLKTELKHIRKRIKELNNLLVEYDKAESTIVSILDHVDQREGNLYTAIGEKGKYTLKDVYIKKGLAIVEFTTDYHINFEFPAFNQFTPNFKYFDPNDVKKEIAIRVDRSGRYRLNIEAKGDWHLTITYESLKD